MKTIVVEKEPSVREKAFKLGRTAFITHIDGQKLCGKGYETKIWVQQDIEELLKLLEKERSGLEMVQCQTNQKPKEA